MYEKITVAGDISVILIDGDPVTMKTRHCARYFNGQFYEWMEMSLGDVKHRVRRWAEWAQNGVQI